MQMTKPTSSTENNSKRKMFAIAFSRMYTTLNLILRLTYSCIVETNKKQKKHLKTVIMRKKEQINVNEKRL